jgi:hypothetical protein
MVVAPGILRGDPLSFELRHGPAHLLGAGGEKHLDGSVEAALDRRIDISGPRPETGAPEKAFCLSALERACVAQGHRARLPPRLVAVCISTT